MITAFSETGWADYQYWLESNPTLLERINELIKAIKRDPFKGIGKPEPLRGKLAGYWSRRTNDEHRLVYKVEGLAFNNW
jgi:toxin YoeB